MTPQDLAALIRVELHYYDLTAGGYEVGDWRTVLDRVCASLETQVPAKTPRGELVNLRDLRDAVLNEDLDAVVMRGLVLGVLDRLIGGDEEYEEALGKNARTTGGFPRPPPPPQAPSARGPDEPIALHDGWYGFWRFYRTAKAGDFAPR